ncbi:hypothetical protein E1301_Tti011578 [Triplophysa tibetana]|uniref:Uncharacterized protein n=1 Tax=Triplophysa tibetana TaxID=1572043 RepID=A0A5A9PI37_9TELE|nr:hypothetical protein E1301_Tti011578 [Triplophysa tibetana]
MFVVSQTECGSGHRNIFEFVRPCVSRNLRASEECFNSNQIQNRELGIRWKGFGESHPHVLMSLIDFQGHFIGPVCWLMLFDVPVLLAFLTLSSARGPTPVVLFRFLRKRLRFLTLAPRTDSLQQKDERIEELEEALRESVQITAEREMVLAQEESARSHAEKQSRDGWLSLVPARIAVSATYRQFLHSGWNSAPIPRRIYGRDVEMRPAAHVGPVKTFSQDHMKTRVQSSDMIQQQNDILHKLLRRQPTEESLNLSDRVEQG